VRYAVGGRLYFAKPHLSELFARDYTPIIGRHLPNKPQEQARLVHGYPRPNYGKLLIYSNKKSSDFSELETI